MFRFVYSDLCLHGRHQWLW